MVSKTAPDRVACSRVAAAESHGPASGGAAAAPPPGLGAAIDLAQLQSELSWHAARQHDLPGPVLAAEERDRAVGARAGNKDVCFRMVGSDAEPALGRGEGAEDEACQSLVARDAEVGEASAEGLPVPEDEVLVRLQAAPDSRSQACRRRRRRASRWPPSPGAWRSGGRARADSRAGPDRGRG